MAFFTVKFYPKRIDMRGQCVVTIFGHRYRKIFFTCKALAQFKIEINRFSRKSPKLLLRTPFMQIIVNCANCANSNLNPCTIDRQNDQNCAKLCIQLFIFITDINLNFKLQRLHHWAKLGQIVV